MLPSTATPLAKAMDMLEERLLALPVELIAKDPWAASVHVLDHLAWENSVDGWDTSWPEGMKRKVIAAAAEVHRYKGTPFAISRALEALGIEAELTEWWQAVPEGAPGTFSVSAFVENLFLGESEITLSEGIQQNIRAVIESAAPVSRAFDLWVGVGAQGRAVGGAFPGARLRVVASATVPPPPEVNASASRALIPTVQLYAVARQQ